MPALFIGQCFPMNIILKSDFTDHLSELGKYLHRPEAILEPGSTSEENVLSLNAF